jgi:hypothetical protein
MRTYPLVVIAIAALCGCERAPDAARTPVARADAQGGPAVLPDSPVVVGHRDSLMDARSAPRPELPAALQWDQADADVPRLSPDSFPRLPNAVRAELNRRDCVVPQTYGDTARHNVVTGAFTSHGAVEWAVLCSVKRESRILVLDAATGAVVDSLEKVADKQWLQTIGDGKIGFSRFIGVLPMSVMKDRTTDDDDKPIPQPIDHDAINESFLEKAGSAHYRAGGLWYRIMTSD